MKNIKEAKLVGLPGVNGKTAHGRDVRHPQAELTEPGEKPDMFNNQPISEIRSPTGKKIKFKFFTGKGSEYILSEANECRRIKCEIHGREEAGLHDWNQFAFFSPLSSDEIVDSDFDDIIRYAFSKKDIIKKDIHPYLMYKIHGSNLYFYYYSFTDRKWHAVSSINEVMKLRLCELHGNPIPETKTKPILTNISLDPKVGYSIVELTVNESGTSIKRYHPGHEVSYVEKPESTAKSVKPIDRNSTIYDVYAACKEISKAPVGSAPISLKTNLGRKTFGKLGISTCGDLFGHLIEKHGKDYQFSKCFMIRGRKMTKLGGVSCDGNEIVITADF